MRMALRYSFCYERRGVGVGVCLDYERRGVGV